MNLLDQISHVSIPELRQQQRQIHDDINRFAREQNTKFEALGLIIDAALKLQPEADVIDADFTITTEPAASAAEFEILNEPHKIEPGPCPEAKESQQEAELPPKRRINPRCKDQSLFIPVRAALFLESEERATAMAIGIAIGMPQPGDMAAILNAHNDKFMKTGQGFWKLK